MHDQIELLRSDPIDTSACCKVHPVIAYVFNVFYFILGISIIVVGIWIQKNPISTYMDPESIQLYNGSIFLIICGGVFMFLTVLGCRGVKKQSHCLLVAQFIFFVLLLIGGIVGSVLVFTQYKQDMKESVTDYLTKATMDFRRKDYATKLMTDVESEFGCCGASRGAMDYLEQSNTPNCQMKYMATPCAPKVVAFLEKKVVGAVVAILIVILTAVICSGCVR